MTVLLQDGFEEDLTPWLTYLINGTLVSETANPRTGLRNAKASRPASAALSQVVVYQNFSNPVIFAEVAVKFLSLPASYLPIFRLEGADYNYVVQIGVDGGLWVLIVAEAGVYQTATLTSGPTVGQYNVIKMKRDITTGSQQIWINGVLAASFAQAQTGNTLSVSLGILYYDGADAVGVCFDDVTIADADWAAAPGLKNLTYNSTPISAPLTYDGKTLQPGGSAQVPEGVPLTISVPGQVTV